MLVDKKDILSAWHENAPAWIESIQNNEIRSRALMTNQAIIREILSVAPKTLLDAGCGEGWLCRQLSKKGINTTGIDGVKTLIEQARKYGLGNYFTISYEDIILDKKNGLGIYEAIVFNYSIFEKENVSVLFKKLKKHLTENGKIIIQTISPKNELFSKRPTDGWMMETWDSLNNNYKTGFKWYYRINEEWLYLFEKTGFKLFNKRENINPENGKNFSIIYTIQKIG